MPRRWVGVAFLVPTGVLGWWGGRPTPVPVPVATPAPSDLIWREPVSGGGVAGVPTMFGTIRQNAIPRDRSYRGAGIKAVVLRAANAEGADVVTGTDPERIRVVATAEGNEVGYHPADPNVERVASPTSLDLAARALGPTLVIAAVNERASMHHTTHLVRIRLIVPPGVAVTRQPTPLVNGATPGVHLEAP